MSRAAGITFGPDSNLYVGGFNNSVYRFSGITGQYLGVFATDPAMTASSEVTFGPDGSLYVASENSSKVYWFNGVTGLSKGVFTSGGSWSGADFILFVPEPAATPLLTLALILAIRRARTHGCAALRQVR
jgi:hypothetical protein